MRKSWRGSSNSSKMPTYLNEKCNNERCKEDHKHGDCRGGDCKATEDYTPAIVDAIRMGFQLCCSFPRVDMSASQFGDKYVYSKKYFSPDSVTPCVDYNYIPNDVANDVQSRGASHIVTLPRACAMTSPESKGGFITGFLRVKHVVRVAR
jgi:hypothetical protein